MKRYHPQEIEPKWQAVWEETGIFRAPDKPKDKTYVIPMFPYPSADGLHVGHPRPYTASDITAHFMRYQGRDVLHATGWDAFGLPAENAAIKKGVHPAVNTAQNIDNFRRQLKSLGLSYDWTREVNTSDPDYYRWTQWIFTQLFKAGLAYRAPGMQWWCPNDKTVLANEQVIDGRCERCGTEVTKKELTQWYFKVTDYAQELLDNLEELDWPESIKALQRNWIGRSEGADVKFVTDAGDITVYTTRPDTIFGATYLVLAPEHELVDQLTTKEQHAEVSNYVEQTKKQTEIARTATDKEKTGVFTGSLATNPANSQKIPVWIADYVLASYGTGAIMAVPAHDERDYQFAQKFDLPITQVVMPETGEPVKGEEERLSIVAVVEDKDGQILTLNWKDGSVLLPAGGREKGESIEETVRREVAEETGYTSVGEVTVLGQARNHYTSIAVKKKRVSTAYLVHATLNNHDQDELALDATEEGMFGVQWRSKAEAVAAIKDPMHARAVEWYLQSAVYTDEGPMMNSGDYDGLESSEAREKIVADLQKKKVAEPKVGFKLRDWLISRQRYWGCPIPIVYCEKCGEVAVPEDQLPVELPEIEDYLPTGDGRSPLAKVDDFVNTTCPECDGPARRETDTMDTFADSSWYFLRYPDPQDANHAWSDASVKAWAPVDWYIGGADHAVLHLIYARFWTMALADLKLLNFREPFLRLRHHGMIQATDGQKMSKSKGNVVNPDEIVEAMGADTLRTYEMFIGPYQQSANWSTESIEGVLRFLRRVWTFGQELIETKTEAPDTRDDVALAALSKAINTAVQNVTRSIESFRFNTAVSSLMEALNEFYRLKDEAGLDRRDEWRAAFETYLVLLSVFAPHLTEELWQQLGHESSIFTGRWPDVDESALEEDDITIVVQVNGKVRANIDFPVEGLTEEIVTDAAKAVTGIENPGRIVYVPGKLINLVV